MRPIDADALMRCIPNEEIVSKAVVANAPTIEPPEHLTDDDIETIRIHLNAYKEKLCNQRRWEEAEEYQRIIDRFIAFASVQPEPRWIPCEERLPENGHYYLWCSDMGSVQSDYYWNGFENGMKYGYNIVAWMPLPKPYKEDSDG